MVANSPHYSPNFKSSYPPDHNVILFLHHQVHDSLNDTTMISQLWDIYVLPVPYQEGTYMSFKSLTKEEHICPSSPLPRRDIYVLPVPYQGGTYIPRRDIYVLPVPYQGGTYICPSSPVRVNPTMSDYKQTHNSQCRKTPAR